VEKVGADFKKVFKSRLYKFTINLVQFIDTLGTDNTSKRIADQLLRSGTSIISNYVEGQYSLTRKELIFFLSVSVKSVQESKLWLSILKDTNRCDAEKQKELLDELKEFSKILSSSILTLKEKQKAELITKRNLKS
jgi:four helix bundle protein